jgi:hypothetical protein
MGADDPQDLPRNHEGSRRVIELPTSQWRKGMPGLLAGMTGILNGGPIGAKAEYCVWIESGGTRTPVIWPHGYTARLDPLEVINANGVVVARAGDMIRVAGGAFTADPALPCMLDQTQVFTIHSEPVILASGSPS